MTGKFPPDVQAELELLRRQKEEALDLLAARETEIEALSEDLRSALRLLEESRDRYADLYEFAPVGYVTLTVQGVILGANATFTTMVGLTPRALDNAPFNLVLATAADLRIFHSHLRICQERGTRSESELRLKHRDGSLLDVQISSVPTADYASLSVVYRTAVIDITEKKRAEASRDETRRQLQLVMDVAPVPIAYLDRELRFVFVNAEYLKKFRLVQEDVLGHSFRVVHGSEADDLIGDRFERAINGEASTVESTVTCQRSGERYYLRVDVAPDCASGDTPCGVVVVATDLTEQKRILEEIREAKESADRANLAKSQFLANMSHELRTPMNGLLGMIQLALDGYTEPLEPKQRDVLTKAYGAGKSLLRILNDILDLSKVEAGTLSLEQRPFSLRHCVDEAVSMFADQAQQKGVSLGLAVADDVPAGLIGDFVRLRQVLINLIGNAVKFTDKGRVQVEVIVGDRTPEGSTIIFTVSDTGIGIPDNKKHLLFRPFSQADPSHTRLYGGTGIGLSISEKIIRMMGGHICFESTEGTGSSFSFAIPFQEAEPPEYEALPASEKPAAPAPEVRAKYRVLVAEDDLLAGELLKSVLEMKGLEMDLAQTGREALDKWEKGSYDLIIMDVQMPKMDGLTATRLIREQERERGGHIPILAMTAHANKEEEAMCLAKGMDAFIAKPVDLNQGLSLVMSLISWSKPEAG